MVRYSTFSYKKGFYVLKYALKYLIEMLLCYLVSKKMRMCTRQLARRLSSLQVPPSYT